MYNIPKLWSYSTQNYSLALILDILLDNCEIHTDKMTHTVIHLWYSIGSTSEDVADYKHTYWKL